MPQNLIDGLFSEMNRVRDIIKEYEAPYLVGAGMLAARIMKSSIQEAENSIAENDIIKMMKAYENLKTYEQ